MRFLLVGLAIVGGAFSFLFGDAAASAGCHIRYAAQQYVAPYVAPVAAVATYLAVPVVVPAYAVGYSQGAVTYQAQEAAAELPRVQTCEEQLAEFKARLYALEARQGGNVGVKAPVAASVIVNRCATCHDASVAKAKGKGVILTKDGQDTLLSDALRFKAITEVMEGRMPKDGPPLSEEEVTSILLQLSRPSAVPAPAPVTTPAPTTGATK